MARGLEGKRIVLAGSRKLNELGVMIEKQGGETVVRSQQGLLQLAESEVEHDLRLLLDSGADWMVFTTGTGLEAILNLAEQHGFRDRIVERIKQSRVAARGYKTFAMLKGLGVVPEVTDDDGTVQGLIRALEPNRFEGSNVMLQLHGELMPELVHFLEEQGASVRSILAYKHIPPDSEVSLQLCKEVAEGAIDAVCFTTAVQVRYLYEFARQHGYADRLTDSFNTRVLAAAVGRVTADALREAGVERLVAPELERMGAMLVEVARYYQQQAEEGQ
ncbi:uroporphyrinogen-III synthase [Paenibacillus sp. GCM10012307]|uniref:Uroporphyrinogen-III synthase n=1 Tax=Paenibacillus roseus TaxID=2798579 RepID=A0A934MQ09_9BACL|nr:uroporphyrinogen-III synthase [Paenibacillus roseus]MBJ6362651.1 uroporphyrinogen-III synthase [Paenibacillus roseus]